MSQVLRFKGRSDEAVQEHHQYPLWGGWDEDFLGNIAGNRVPPLSAIKGTRICTHSAHLPPIPCSAWWRDGSKLLFIPAGKEVQAAAGLVLCWMCKSPWFQAESGGV